MTVKSEAPGRDLPDLMKTLDGDQNSEGRRQNQSMVGGGLSRKNTCSTVALSKHSLPRLEVIHKPGEIRLGAFFLG